MGQTMSVNPEDMRARARTIRQKANDYRDKYNAFLTLIENTKKSHTGVANTAMVTQITGFKPEFESMYQLMVDYAKYLEDGADTYDEAESNITRDAQGMKN